MNNLLLLLVSALLLISTDVIADETKKNKSGISVRNEDREIADMVEMLDLLEMLEKMEMMEDMDIFAGGGEDEHEK